MKLSWKKVSGATGYKVYIYHSGTKIYHAPLMKAENVEFKWNSKVSKFLFDKRLNGVEIENVENGTVAELNLDGLFISIGRAPSTELFKGQLELDEFGYIIADENTKTNIEGVFAVGDVRTKPVRQIVTATADGAVAVHFAQEYI